MKYLRRLVWHIASRLLVLVCVLGILVTVFYFAMNASNIYVFLKDGMAKRAQVVMMGEDEGILRDYFSDYYLQRDPMLRAVREGGSVYTNYYSITGIDHRLRLEFVWCWPWNDSAQATFVESVEGIDGRMKASVRSMASGMGLPSAPPAWNTIRYKAVLTRERGKWTIRSLEQVAVLSGTSQEPQRLVRSGLTGP